MKMLQNHRPSEAQPQTTSVEAGLARSCPPSAASCAAQKSCSEKLDTGRQLCLCKISSAPLVPATRVLFCVAVSFLFLGFVTTVGAQPLQRSTSAGELLLEQIPEGTTISLLGINRPGSDPVPLTQPHTLRSFETVGDAGLVENRLIVLGTRGDASGRDQLTLERLALIGAPAAGELMRIVPLRNSQLVPERPRDMPLGSRIEQPRLLLQDGRLLGMAWLQGPSRGALQVYASAYDPQERFFGAPEAVSGPAPGSQLSLSAVVLEDQSWLLVWSAFDGNDDEIMLRQRVAGEWLPKRQLTQNDVPDITPVATWTNRGAFVAWSGYDGNDYRLKLAALGPQGQADEGTVTLGGKGGLYPAFVGETSTTDNADLARLVFYESKARAWTVLSPQRAFVAARNVREEGRAALEISLASEAVDWVATFESGSDAPPLVFSYPTETKLFQPSRSSR